MNKVGIELSVESGGFISGIASAERSVESLTQAMKQAKDEGRNEDFVRLQIQRDTLSASTSGFKRDTQKLFSEPRLQTTTASGATVLKMDSDQAMAFKDLNSTIKKLTSVYVDQINNKDFQGAQDTFSQIQQEQGKYKKAVEEATTPGMGQKAQDAMKAVVFGQIANSINDGLRIWANSLDRSGIINAYGSGDILGGRIAEKQRQADIWGGGAQTVFGLAGGIATATGNPLLGIGLSATGQGINTLAHGLVNPEKTDTAYAGLWQQRSADAMNLAALMGNPNMIREAFKTAADAASAFGYSAEEGVDALNQAVRQGMNGDKAREVTEQIFRYERATGADRGTLSSVTNMATRYGAGDALRAGWAGLHASGMSPGQYNEYLRAMQRVMEDGISKGFVRSSDQVAQNLAMIAQIGGDNKTWQGEGGARRLQSMSGGLENAVGLQSSNDIHVYRAARQIAEKENPGASWVDVQRLVEQGLGGGKGSELQYRTWAMDYNSEGGGREGFVSRQVQRGQSYDAAIKMWDYFAPTFEGVGKDIEAAIEVFGSLDKNRFEKYKNEPLPDASSPELELAQLSAKVANIQIQTGQIILDNMLPELRTEPDKALAELEKQILLSSDPTGMSPRGATNYYEQIQDAAERAGDFQTGRWAEGVQQNLEADVWNQERDEMIGRRDMLIRNGGDRNRTSFFTGNSNPFTKNDDERDYDNFMALERRVGYDPSPDKNILDRVYTQLAQFDNTQREEVNRNDTLNSILARNDLTAQKLYEAVIELSRNMGVRIVYE